MSDERSRQVEECLSGTEMHDRWVSTYYGDPENEKFYEMAFDYITKALNPPEGATFLDAGCGNCAHSVRLIRRGYKVVAVDFSNSAVKKAAKNVTECGVAESLKLQQEDLTNLSFNDYSFDYILCWGVLMHVPDVAAAVAELSRALKPGGQLVISEGNMNSLYSMSIRNLRKLIGKGGADVKITEAGIENWRKRGSGKLVVRHSNNEWLKSEFKKNGLDCKEHIAGQFSEAYTSFKIKPLRSFAHWLNSFWFRKIRNPDFAFGNILIFQRK